MVFLVSEKIVSAVGDEIHFAKFFHEASGKNINEISIFLLVEQVISDLNMLGLNGLELLELLKNVKD